MAWGTIQSVWWARENHAAQRVTDRGLDRYGMPGNGLNLAMARFPQRVDINGAAHGIMAALQHGTTTTTTTTTTRRACSNFRPVSPSQYITLARIIVLYISSVVPIFFLTVTECNRIRGKGKGTISTGPGLEVGVWVVVVVVVVVAFPALWDIVWGRSNTSRCFVAWAQHAPKIEG